MKGSNLGGKKDVYPNMDLTHNNPMINPISNKY